MNTDDPWPDLDEAELRVLGMQTKLHQWAMTTLIVVSMTCTTSSLIPPFLVVAWRRVRGNGGHARPGSMEWNLAPSSSATATLLAGLRDDLKARRFFPMPVRETMIPKASGKLRRLGIPTVLA